MKIVCNEIGYAFVFDNCTEVNTLIKNLSNYSAFMKHEKLENETFVYVTANDSVPTEVIQNYATELKTIFTSVDKPARKVRNKKNA